MWQYKALQLIRRLKIMLGLHTERSKYHIKNLSFPIDATDFYETMITLGYQYNPVCMQEKGQLFSVRKLYDRRQIHIRLFEDEITGHDEYNYEFAAYKHIRGVNVKPVSNEEHNRIDALVDALM